jgi:uncharacterized protein YjdB
MHRRTTTRAPHALVAAIAAAAALTACSSSSHRTTIEAVTVSPASTALALGASRAFTATALRSDGSEQDVTASAAWATSDASVVRLGTPAPTGVEAIGAALGAAQVSATLEGVTGSAAVTVTAATLQSLSVWPAFASVATGFSRQLTATATFTDGSKADVTADATWSTSSAAVATVTAGGAVTGQSPGSATLSAAYSGLTASTALTVTAATLQSIAVTPGASTLPLGVGVSLTATGLFSDGTAQDVTDAVTWSSGDPAIVTVSAGLVQPVSMGAATITAALAGQIGAATIEVTLATLDQIDVFPGAVTLARGTTAAFTAVGTFSDGSSADITASATWSADTGGVLLSSPGAEGVLATAAATGTTTITAALGAVSASAAVTVTPAELASLALAPAATSLPVGLTEQLSATGTFTDGSTQDLTAQVSWLSSDDAVAATSNAPGSEGLVSAVSPGSAIVTATVFGVSATAEVAVTAAALQTVTVSPTSARVPAGYQLRFTATGTYTDGSTHDVTSSADWASSDTAIATVVAIGASAGTATGVAPGTVTVTATLDGVSGSATLNVASARLTSIAVEPPTFTVAVGGAQPLRAIGTFSDASTADITRQCVWSSSSKATAVVSRGGVVTGVRAGAVTITAKRSGKQGRAAGDVR